MFCLKKTVQPLTYRGEPRPSHTHTHTHTLNNLHYKKGSRLPFYKRTAHIICATAEAFPGTRRHEWRLRWVPRRRDYVMQPKSKRVLSLLSVTMSTRPRRSGAEGLAWTGNRGGYPWSLCCSYASPLPASPRRRPPA
eukprot:1181279-Prorocentrum_minimum.AAC.3